MGLEKQQPESQDSPLQEDHIMPMRSKRPSKPSNPKPPDSETEDYPTHRKSPKTKS